jgi:hypothetical protein
MFDCPFDIEQDFSDVEGDEAGMASIRYNNRHVDLGLVNVAGDGSNSIPKYFQERTTGSFIPLPNPGVTVNITIRDRPLDRIRSVVG